MKNIIRKILREEFPFGGHRAPEDDRLGTVRFGEEDFELDSDEMEFYADFEDPEFWDELDDDFYYDDFPIGGHKAPKI